MALQPAREWEAHQRSLRKKPPYVTEQEDALEPQAKSGQQHVATEEEDTMQSISDLTRELLKLVAHRYIQVTPTKRSVPLQKIDGLLFTVLGPSHLAEWERRQSGRNKKTAKAASPSGNGSAMVAAWALRPTFDSNAAHQEVYTTIYSSDDMAEWRTSAPMLAIRRRASRWRHVIQCGNRPVLGKVAALRRRLARWKRRLLYRRPSAFHSAIVRASTRWWSSSYFISLLSLTAVCVDPSLGMGAYGCRTKPINKVEVAEL